MARDDVVVALTGASGVPYGVRLLERLLTAGRSVHVTISPAFAEVFAREMGRPLDLKSFQPAALFATSPEKLGRLVYWDYRDFGAGIASGSFLTAGMAICPCSMGTLAAIASGLSQNLIHRAADVHLKERRKLVLVPRETPLGLTQLRNMVAVAEAGAVVLPAMPAFYTRPKSISDMVDFIVGRVMDQLGVENELIERWGES